MSDIKLNKKGRICKVIFIASVIVLYFAISFIVLKTIAGVVIFTAMLLVLIVLLFQIIHIIKKTRNYILGVKRDWFDELFDNRLDFLYEALYLINDLIDKICIKLQGRDNENKT